MRKHVSFVPVFMMVSIYKVELFFSIAAVFSYVYLGSDSSPIYVVLMIGIGVVNIAVGLHLIFRSNKVSIQDLFLLLGLPLFVFISLLLAKLESGSIARNLQQNYFNTFLAFSLPALFIGWYIVQKKIDIYVSLFFVMLFITAGSISSILVPFLSGQSFTVMGGASYQAASYYTSFALGINLYILMKRDKHQNFNLKGRSFIFLFQLVLIPIQAIMVIVPGGRGAFVLMLGYFFLASLKFLTPRNVIKMIVGLLVIGFLVFLVSKVFPRLAANDIFQRGFSRAIAFIGKGGTINWDGTSERLPIYQESIALIERSPIFGYGLYGYLSHVSFRGYPHNFFLEILLQGGLIYLVLWIGFLGYLFRKLFLMIKQDKRNKVFLYLGLYPAVQLMFSGSYLSNGLLWFVIAYIVFSEKNGI